MHRLRQRAVRALLATTAGLLLALVTRSEGHTPFPQVGETSVDSTVVARFDTVTVDRSEFERQYLSTVDGVAAARADSTDEYLSFLERYVNYRLKLLDARRRGLDEGLYRQEGITSRPGELARRHLVRENHERRLRSLHEHGKEELKVSHFMVKVPRDAPPEDTLEAYRRMEALVDSLESGTSFHEVAVHYSDDSSAPTDSGKIGWIAAGSTSLRYENRVWKTPTGERTPIFRGPIGYYVVKVHDRRAGLAPRRISHLYVNPRGDSVRARKRALAFRDSVRAGKDFARLAYQYSDHSQTAQRGGDFGWVHYTELYQQTPAFARGAFDLDSVGAVSDVVRSSYGYHLIKLTDMQDTTSFAAARPHLEERMGKLARGTNLERKTARRLMRRLGHSVDSSVVEALIAELPDDRESAWERLRSDGVPPGLEDRVVATIGDSTYTLGRLAQRLKAIQAAPEIRPTVDRELDEFLESRVFAYVVPRLRREDPAFARTLREYRNGALLYRASQQSVWEPAQRDSEGLREYYRAHRDRYRWPRRYHAISFRGADRGVLDQVVRELEDGTPVSTIAERVEGQSVQVDTLHLADSLHTPHDRVFSMEPGAHTDVIPYRTEYLVLRLNDVEAPRAKTFEEARVQVAQGYQTVLEERWVERLREEYDVRVYPEHLRWAFTGDDLPEAPAGSPLPTRTTSRSQERP